MTVYLLPTPPEPPVVRALPTPPAAEIVDEAPDIIEPEPEETERPAAQPPSVTPEAPTVAEAEAPANAADAPERRRIDWNAAISRAIARVREQQPPQYRSFGFPEREPAEEQGSASRSREPRAPWATPRPGEAADPGRQEVAINDDCYYEMYAPGSLLAEAHRFSNSLLSCHRSAPREPRNDLFLEAKPDYLE